MSMKSPKRHVRSWPRTRLKAQLAHHLDEFITVPQHSLSAIHSVRFCSALCCGRECRAPSASHGPGSGVGGPPGARRESHGRAHGERGRRGGPGTAERGHRPDRPLLPAAGVRGMGHEPRLVRQRHRRLSRARSKTAGGHALRGRRPRSQHRPVQHRRRQRPRRPQGLHEGRRHHGGLLESPSGDHPAGHGLVGSGQPGPLELGCGRRSTLVGGPDQGQGQPLGGVQQLAALVPDRQRLRLRRLRREHRPDPRGPRRRLRHLPGAGDRAHGAGARHRVRHDRPAERAQHALLGHPARRGRSAHGRAPGRRARGPRTPAEGDPRAGQGARRGTHRRQDLRDGRDQPRHLHPELERLRHPRASRRRPAQRAHLRHRPAHQRPGHRQGRGQEAVDERGRGHLGHRHRLHRYGTGTRHRHPDGRRHA